MVMCAAERIGRAVSPCVRGGSGEASGSGGPSISSLDSRCRVLAAAPALKAAAPRDAAVIDAPRP
ncbi:hypothetical protein BE15_06640 [Sorangium cellulosum]|uniref:Uncharacterized protein n=1 Tax=Sorangium cellulosum TaxID=56 RepID=A0A150QWY9_SORCE|nr:hypothetical protein BE15_06640 [Sorangium cellulosum]